MKMGTRQIVARTAGVILMAGALVGTGARVQASGDKAQVRAIEGVWAAVVSIRDCQSQAVLFTFPTMEIYIRGGSLLLENSSTPEARSTGMGTWQHAGGRDYTAAYRFFAYNPDGSVFGVLRVSSTIRLNARGTAFTTSASDTFEVSDLNGTAIEHGCGTRQGTRLQ
jgi:hypothetical protein